MARHARAQARRDHVQLWRAPGSAQGAPLAAADEGDGQGPARGTRRRPGGSGHRLPDGRRGTSHVRRDDSFGAARQVGNEHPPADRSGRDHHALELPHRHPVLEDDGRPDHRQHCRAQAGQRHAPVRGAARRADARSGLPAGHGQHGHRVRQRSGHAARGEPGRERHLASPATATPGATYPPAAPSALLRISLELGGKNAIAVMADADLDLAADGILWSAFGTTGQRCTACSRLVVDDSVADDLIGRLADRARQMRLGDGRQPTDGRGPADQRRRAGEGGPIRGHRDGRGRPTHRRWRQRDDGRPAARPLLPAPPSWMA